MTYPGWNQRWDWAGFGGRRHIAVTASGAECPDEISVCSLELALIPPQIASGQTKYLEDPGVIEILT